MKICLQISLFTALLLLTITPDSALAGVTVSGNGSGNASALGIIPGDSDSRSKTGLSGGVRAVVSGNTATAVWSVTPGSAYFAVYVDGSNFAGVDLGLNFTQSSTGAPLRARAGQVEMTSSVAPEHFINNLENGQLGVTARSSNGFRGMLSQSVTWSPVDEDDPGRNKDKSRRYDTQVKDEETGAVIVLPPGDPGDLEEGATVANDTAGAYLTWNAHFSSLPVDNDLGIQSPGYFGGPPTENSPLGETVSGYHPTAYYFGSLTVGITSFVVPDGIPGDTSNLVIDDGETLTPYVPGTTHVFSTPLRGFALRGLDATAMPTDGEPAPFVHGLTFNRAGSAILYHAAYPAPRIPGDFDDDADVDGRDFLIWQRGERPIPHSAEELAAWHENYGNPSSLVTTTIPEPAGLTVLLGFILSASIRSCWLPR
jgi:hypothetical protein